MNEYLKFSWFRCFFLKKVYIYIYIYIYNPRKYNLRIRLKGKYRSSNEVLNANGYQIYKYFQFKYVWKLTCRAEINFYKSDEKSSIC